MSINPKYQMVPFTTIKMLNESVKLLGLPKLHAQVILTLPNIKEFNHKLKESITFSKDEIECFIITSSAKDEVKEIIEEFSLNESFISNDFKFFADSFGLKDESNSLTKSIMMINKNCQIVHKEIL